MRFNHILTRVHNICYSMYNYKEYMEQENFYVPMNELILNKETSWTFTHTNLQYTEIIKRGIVLWCVENLKGKWTMLGGNKFGFEDGNDATVFRMHFGF